MGIICPLFPSMTGTVPPVSVPKPIIKVLIPLSLILSMEVLMFPSKFSPSLNKIIALWVRVSSAKFFKASSKAFPISVLWEPIISEDNSCTKRLTLSISLVSGNKRIASAAKATKPIRFPARESMSCSPRFLAKLRRLTGTSATSMLREISYTKTMSIPSNSISEDKELPLGSNKDKPIIIVARIRQTVLVVFTPLILSRENSFSCSLEKKN